MALISQELADVRDEVVSLRSLYTKQASELEMKTNTINDIQNERKIVEERGKNNLI